MMTYACCKCKFVTSLTNQIFVSLYGVKMASIGEISSVSLFLDSLEAVIHHEIFSIASKCNLISKRVDRFFVQRFRRMVTSSQTDGQEQKN